MTTTRVALFTAIQITNMAIEARDNSCACKEEYTCSACKMFGELIQHVTEAALHESSDLRKEEKP